jgi:hypothetical protein
MLNSLVDFYFRPGQSMLVTFVALPLVIEHE